MGRAETLHVNPENFDDMIYWKWDAGSPYFYSELHIKRVVKEHDKHYFVGGYSNKIITRYIGIFTDKEGDISFFGKRGPFAVRAEIPRVRWDGDSGILGGALGKVSRHPLISERQEMFDNPVFDKFGDYLKRKLKEEHKDDEI